MSEFPSFLAMESALVSLSRALVQFKVGSHLLPVEQGRSVDRPE